MSALSSNELKEVAKFGPRGKLPDKKTDAEGWNAVSWAKPLAPALSNKFSQDVEPLP